MVECTFGPGDAVGIVGGAKDLVEFVKLPEVTRIDPVAELVGMTDDQPGIGNVSGFELDGFDGPRFLAEVIGAEYLAVSDPATDHDAGLGEV